MGNSGEAASLEARVGDLERQQQRIANVLNDIRKFERDTTEKLDKIQHNFGQGDQKFESIEKSLEGLNAGLTQLNTELLEFLKKQAAMYLFVYKDAAKKAGF